VLLIFFFNAILFSYLLLKKGVNENKKDHKWLAAFIFLGGLYLCPFMLGYANWYSITSYRQILFFVPFQQLFLIGPILYIYTKTLLNPHFKFTHEDYIHFLPALAYLIYSLVVFVYDKFLVNEFYFYADGKDKDLDFWYQMTGLMSMLFYLFRSIQYYRKYRRLSVQEVSFADEIAYKWINHFTIAFSAILLLRVLFFILNPEWGNFGSKYWYYLCFSILLLYIAISGYSNAIRTTIAFSSKDLPELEPSNENNGPVAKNEPVDSEAIQKWKEKIILLFKEKEVYKNPNLTLTDVALHLNTNRNIVSKAINQEFNMNFNDFVNKKRAEAVIEKLKQEEHHTSTLLGITLDCGFNSKTIFNRAFKKHTSLTPNQYLTKKGFSK
jgi:AraC-like DNA-binding protein